VITSMTSHSEFEGIGVARVLGFIRVATMVRSTFIQHSCDWRLGRRIIRGNNVLQVRTTIRITIEGQRRCKGGMRHRTVHNLGKITSEQLGVTIQCKENQHI